MNEKGSTIANGLTRERGAPQPLSKGGSITPEWVAALDRNRWQHCSGIGGNYAPEYAEALDTVRKAEYARLSGKERRFIKGQKYTLLSRHENLSVEGRQGLKTLLAANKRLNTAYLLKESFGQLWDYEREGWARRFFENWRNALKWQRLKPYEKFAALIDRHWDGIAAYCKPENKVSLGFVEGLNNKIRVIQRRAYGLRDEEYLRLKILTCMLPAL